MIDLGALQQTSTKPMGMHDGVVLQQSLGGRWSSWLTAIYKGTDEAHLPVRSAIASAPIVVLNDIFEEDLQM